MIQQINALIGSLAPVDKEGQNVSDLKFSSILTSAISQANEDASAVKRGTVAQDFSYIVPILRSMNTDTDPFTSFESALTGDYDFTDSDLTDNDVSAFLKGIGEQSDTMVAAVQACKVSNAYAGYVPASQNLAVSMSGVSNSALYIRAVIDSFNVQDNPRYQVNRQGRNETYCNIYVSDVTRALGAEVPHYADKTTGQPVSSGENAIAMNANRMNDWLNGIGRNYGWVKVTAQQAQNYANNGRPAVASWKNDSGHGHIQIVSPSADGTYDPARGVAIAQAGSKLINYGYIEDVYKTSRLAQIDYFVNLQ